jgi:hypothetical protein
VRKKYILPFNLEILKPIPFITDSQSALQNYPPKRSRMPNPLAITYQRNRQRHNRNEYPSHRAKRAHVARLDPRIDAVKEAESHDILDMIVSNKGPWVVSD